MEPGESVETGSQLAIRDQSGNGGPLVRIHFQVSYGHIDPPVSDADSMWESIVRPRLLSNTELQKLKEVDPLKFSWAEFYRPGGDPLIKD